MDRSESESEAQVRKFPEVWRQCARSTAPWQLAEAQFSFGHRPRRGKIRRELSQRPLLMAFGNGNFAASVPFARVLAGATVVTRFAAPLPLTLVLPFATMLGRRRTTAMAFAGVLTGARVVVGFATPLALALVHALARMRLVAFGCLSLSNYTANLRTAGKNPGHSAEQQFVKISSFYTHPESPYKSNAHLSGTRPWHPTDSQIRCNWCVGSRYTESPRSDDEVNIARKRARCYPSQQLWLKV